MLEIPMFWIGPLGRLMPMACPESGLSNKLTMQAAQSTSVNARTTVTLQGFRRVWELSEAWLEPDEVSFLTAMYSGAVFPPLRFIDPLLKNRFRPSVAASRDTSIWSGGFDSWHVPVNNGLATNEINPGFPDIEFTTPGDLREIAYRPDTGILWNPADGGSMFLYPNGAPNADFTYKRSRTDPILPGETLTQSFFTKVDGGSATLHFGYVAADGTPAPGPSVTFSNASWDRVNVSYTAPADGSVVGVYPYFSVTDPAVNLHVGPGQLEEGPEMTDWEMGYGAPEVVITDLSPVSPRYPMTTVSLTITEL